MMILRKLRTIHCAQRGFTLIEILAALAITALIGSAAATATYQVVRINASSTNRQIAITQVENAVHSISRDAQQAQYIIPKDITNNALPMDAITKEISFNLITGDKLTLKWIGWDNNKNEITYTVVNGIMQKTITINDVLTATMHVADNISTASGSWKTDTKVLKLQTKSIVGAGASQTDETRTFQIIPRSAK